MKTLLKGFSILTLSVFLYHGNILGQTINQTDDENGLVVIEAENFTDERTATDGSAWELVTEPANFSGTGAMKATHADNETFTAHKTLADAQTNAPVLMYNVNFVKAEPVYVWARASHIDGYDDSVWSGLDGTIAGTSAQSLTYLTTEQSQTDWYYINHGMDGNRFTIDIASTGAKVFEMYYRETNFIFDQIILTTNADYDPNAATSINEFSQNNLLNLSVYPNPAIGLSSINFNSDVSSITQITLYDVSGRVQSIIFNDQCAVGVNKVTFDFEIYNAGIYVIKLQVGENIGFTKVVID